MTGNSKQKSKLIILIALLDVLLAGGGVLYKSLTSDDKGVADEVLNHNSGADSKKPEDAGASGETPAAEEMPDVIDFTLEDGNGNTYNLSDKFGDKPIVVNLWASWCPPCKSEMPHFQEAYEKYGDRVEFIMVDIIDDVQETRASGKKFLDDNGYSFPINYDVGGVTLMIYTGGGIPCTLFITPEGKLYDGVLGAISKDYLESHIEELLAQ